MTTNLNDELHVAELAAQRVAFLNKRFSSSLEKSKLSKKDGLLSQ